MGRAPHIRASVRKWLKSLDWLLLMALGCLVIYEAVTVWLHVLTGP